MKTLSRIVLALVLFVVLVSPAWSGGPPEQARIPIVPGNAVEVAPGLYYLGAEVHKGTVVEGFALVHYREGHAAKSAKAAPATKCYAFLWKGVRWVSPEPYYIEPSADAAKMLDIMDAAIGRWESAAGTDKDIVGPGFLGPNPLAPGVYNGYNEVKFGLLSDSNAIAVTYIWRTRLGVPQLVEWDQIYNSDPFYCWSFTEVQDWGRCAVYKVDFDNIATHELGHSVGMADLYNSCTQETMYGYASNGEITKRSLNSGDIAGIKALYQ